MWVNLLARESLIHSHLLLLESVGNIRIKMSEANLQLVEGPFKDFTVRRIRPQDVDKVIQHIKEYFLHDEPPSKMLGYSDVYGDDFCHIVKYFLPDNLSLWMEHNETGEVRRCSECEKIIYVSMHEKIHIIYLADLICRLQPFGQRSSAKKVISAGIRFH